MLFSILWLSVCLSPWIWLNILSAAYQISTHTYFVQILVVLLVINILYSFYNLYCLFFQRQQSVYLLLIHYVFSSNFGFDKIFQIFQSIFNPRYLNLNYNLNCDTLYAYSSRPLLHCTSIAIIFFY